MSYRNTSTRHDTFGRYRGKHRAASTSRNNQAATLLGGGMLAAVVGLSGAAGAGAVTTTEKPTSYKTFDDGHGGTNAVKTRADGSVVKTSSKGEVLYDSAKHQAGGNSSTPSSISDAKTPSATGKSAKAPTDSAATGGASAPASGDRAGLTPAEANKAISQTKKGATALTAAEVVAQGNAGKILNTAAGSQVGKDTWKSAQKATGTTLPNGVNKALGAVSVATSAKDFADARQSGDYLKAMRAEVNGATAIAGMAGAGPAATAVNYAAQTGLTLGDKTNTYTKDTTAVQEWQTKTGQHIHDGNQWAVAGDTLTLGGAVIKGAVQKMLGIDPATNAQQSRHGQGMNGSTGSNTGSGSGSQD